MVIAGPAMLAVGLGWFLPRLFFIAWDDLGVFDPTRPLRPKVVAIQSGVCVALPLGFLYIRTQLDNGALTAHQAYAWYLALCGACFLATVGPFILLRPPQGITPVVTCPFCNNPNHATTRRCAWCRLRLPATAPSSDVPTTTEDDRHAGRRDRRSDTMEGTWGT